MIYISKSQEGAEEINLTSLFSGTDNQILVFDDNGSLTSSDGLTWTESSGLKLANNGLNKIELLRRLITRRQYHANEDVVIEDIVVKVGNTLQSSGKDLRLIGMSVKIASDPLYGAGTGVLDNITTAGRLNAGKTAIGLLVDVSNVLAKTAEDDAIKYAAIFAGGAVGISSGTSFDPEALFHIRSYQGDGDYTNEEYEDLFRVDSNSVSNLFVVKESGKVGIGGVQNPSAMVDIEQVESGDDLVVFKDTSGTQLFIVDETGKVGIGTDASETLTSALTVSGDVKATNGYFDYVKADSLSIGEGFSLDASGNVALAPNVAANTGLLISKTLDNVDTATYCRKN